MTHDRRLIEETFPVMGVFNAATKPELHIIQNPAARLEPEEMVEVRYRVWVEEILAGAGEKE